jgi:hypothetical protein
MQPYSACSADDVALMKLTLDQFRKKYVIASESFGVPIPDDSAVREDYKIYLYGSKLLLGERNRLHFYRDDRGRLSWDLIPNH